MTLRSTGKNRERHRFWPDLPPVLRAKAPRSLRSPARLGRPSRRGELKVFVDGTALI